MTQYIGGSFAPPLPPEKVAEYRDKLSRCSRHLSDSAHGMCEMMDVYHPQPRSALRGTPHPTGAVCTGQFTPDGTAITRPAPLIVPLEEPVKAAIFDVVPWDHENEMMKGLFEPVQKDESLQNSTRIQAWSQAVISHIVQRHFPAGDFETTWSALVGLNTNPHLRALMTDDMKAKIEAMVPKVNACTYELQTALSAKQYEPIPRPRLEDTSTRDALHHLLWHAVELEKDREPMTTDRL